jgi:hypothetical protein
MPDWKRDGTSDMPVLVTESPVEPAHGQDSEPEPQDEPEHQPAKTGKGKQAQRRKPGAQGA